MNFIRRVKGLLSERGRALVHYRSGMKKAESHDYRGAIAEYTETIKAAGTPADVKAMATYNRALAYSALHETNNAADDLEAVLKMPELPENIRAAALRRQKRVQRRDQGD